jgi:hypothetical protein
MTFYSPFSQQFSTLLLYFESFYTKPVHCRQVCEENREDPSRWPEYLESYIVIWFTFDSASV